MLVFLFRLLHVQQMIISREAPQLGRLANVSRLALTLKRQSQTYLIVCFRSLTQYCAVMQEYLTNFPILPALCDQTLLAKPFVLCCRRKQCSQC